jgi:hypothetical protein
MTITYTWKVTGVKVKNEGSNTDAVVQTYWTKTGIDENGNEGMFNGATPFTSANVPPGEFVTFENLTEEIILGWIQSVIDENYDIHINSQILKQIQSKANPVIDKELPWAVTE